MRKEIKRLGRSWINRSDPLNNIKTNSSNVFILKVLFFALEYLTNHSQKRTYITDSIEGLILNFALPLSVENIIFELIKQLFHSPVHLLFIVFQFGF